MEVRMENTPSAGGNNEPVHCFVAIKLSKSSLVVGFQTPLAKQTSRYEIESAQRAVTGRWCSESDLPKELWGSLWAAPNSSSSLMTSAREKSPSACGNH